MFSLFHIFRHPSVGICVADDALTGALAVGGVMKSFQRIPLKEKVVEGNIVRDHAGFVEAVKALKAALLGDTKSKKKLDAVLVLPSNLFYSTWVALAEGERHGPQAAMDELPKLIPEETNTLTLLFRTLFTSDKKKNAEGVCAARMDILHEFNEAFQEAGLPLSRITGAPSVLLCSTKKRAKKGSTTLLVNTLHTPASIAVLQDGWPLDELLFEFTDSTSLAQKAQQMLDEYRAFSIVPDRILAISDDTVLTALKSLQGIEVEGYVPSSLTITAEQLTQYAAAIPPGSDLPDFLHAKKQKAKKEKPVKVKREWHFEKRNLLYLGAIILLGLVRLVMWLAFDL